MVLHVTVERVLARVVWVVNVVARTEAVGDMFLSEVVDGSIAVVIKELDAFVVMVLSVTVSVYRENMTFTMKVWLS